MKNMTETAHYLVVELEGWEVLLGCLERSEMAKLVQCNTE